MTGASHHPPEPGRTEPAAGHDDSALLMDTWGGATDWNLIRASGQAQGEDLEQAWRRLVERYRVPVRKMLGRLLRGQRSADDAAPDFFTYLYQQRLLDKADPTQGRFRCYIQGVMKRFVLSYKRSTSMPRSRAEIEAVEDRGEEDASDTEREEELMWAEAVLEHALEQLKRDAPRDANLIVRFYGLGGEAPMRGTDLARESGTSDTSLHVALHRARARLEAVLLKELRMQVTTDEELAEEREFLVSRLLAAHPGLLGE